MLALYDSTITDFDPVVITRRSWRKVRADSGPKVLATLCHGYAAFDLLDQPGLVLFNNDPATRMFLKCPGCGQEAGIMLCGPDSWSKWTLTGSHEKPTLSPSLHHDVPECGWHGFLRNGVFEG